MRCLFCFIAAIGFVCVGRELSAKTTVALTTTVSTQATSEEKQLAANLLALLEFEASQHDALQIVERQQLDLTLHEQVISNANKDQQLMQLGKLSTAELILTAKLIKHEIDKTQHLTVRITESLTGTIRGATLTPIEASTIDEAAQEITQYLLAVVTVPELAGVSISVAPFESLGRFDRLRPLERGLRDLAVAGLRRYAGLRVLQRSEMEQLLREIDLIRGGLVDRQDLPDTLPSRAAAYHLRGTINEQQQDETRQLVVAMKLLQADSQATLATATMTTAPEALPQQLTEKLQQLVRVIKKGQSTKSPHHKLAETQNEVDELFYRSVRDLYHFWRRKPRDFSHREFRLPDLDIRRRTYGSRVPIDSPLGIALIRKSVDRLESVLYLQPERRDAQYALAWCFANHIEGLWQPERAQKLLKNVVAANPSDALSGEALNLLAEIYFHHEKGHCKPSDRSKAWQNVFLALTTMPEKNRDYEWSRLIQLLTMKFHVGPGDIEQTARLLRFVASILKQDGGQRFPAFINPAVKLAQQLTQAENQPLLRSEALRLLREWSASEFAPLRAEGLRLLAYQEKDHDKATKGYLQVAEIYRTDTSSPGTHRYHNALLAAVARLRLAGKSEVALELLDSFSPSRKSRNSLLYGYHGLERGACLESLGRKQEALETYLKYAESDEGLVNNSDVEERIETLGGAPLDPDRDTDVHYVNATEQQTFPCKHIGTDGKRIFIERNRQGIVAFSPDTHSWEQLGGPKAGVTCLAVDGDLLWIGTNKDGLWRCELTTLQWKKLKNLPDQSIVDLLIYQGTVYASIGSRTSGGIVRIDSDDLIHVYQAPASPKTCLYHLTTDGKKLYGVNRNLYVLNLESDQWNHPVDDKTGRPIYSMFVQCDVSGLWGSHYGKEIFLVGAEPKTNQRFSKSWFPRGQGKAGYRLRFATERNNLVWFCGSPWRRFKSVGFYRMNIATGDFKIYGPRDGFRPMSQCYMGTWLNDQLWLATSTGLVEVTLRDPSQFRKESK